MLALLEDGFAQRLAGYLDKLAESRAQAGRRILDPGAYERLPAGQEASGDLSWQVEWRLRGYDLSVVRGLLSGTGPRRVLDVGAWNGWLSNRLAQDGHAVTAVDYFADEYDGLRACQHYQARWRSIQMDLRDLSLLDECFDVIIFNRCLQFFADPVASLLAARRSLAPGGVLIVTGLQVFQAPRTKARQVEGYLRTYREQHGFDLHLFPTKAYLDTADCRGLARLGVRLRRYPQLWPAHLLACLDPSRPTHTYGAWHA